MFLSRDWGSAPYIWRESLQSLPSMNWPSDKADLLAMSLIMVQEGVVSIRCHFISSIPIGISGFGDIYASDIVGQQQACSLC